MKKNKFLVFVGISFWFCLPLISQSDLDGLLKKFSFEKSDTTNINLALDISKAYLASNVENSVKYALISDSLAQKAGFTMGGFRAKNYLGELYGFDLVKPSESTFYFDQAISLSKSLDIPSKELIRPYINKATILYQSSAFGAAIEAFIDADRIAIRENLPESRAKILNNLSLVYRSLNRYQEAVQMLEESILIRTKLDDKKGLASNRFNLAAVYAKMDKFDEAIKEAELAKGLYITLKDNKSIIDCDFNIATILIDKHILLKHQATLKPAYILLEKIEKKKQQLTFTQINQLAFYYYYATACFELGDEDKALAVIESFDLKEVGEGFLSQAKEFYELKAKIYERKGDYRNAHLNLKKTTDLVTEMTKKDNAIYRNEMETKFLTKEKERNIEMLEIKNELTSSRLKTSNLILAILGASAAILSLLLWFYYRLFSKYRTQNIYIEKANKEKTFLLKEIHHRVKNNLQVISSLLGLQSRYVDDKVALEALQTGKLRVQTMSLLHQRLYNNEDLKSININTYFNDLGENLFATYKIDKNNIDFTIDVDDVDLDVDVVIPMGLIVNELMTNSLKYAFKDRENGKMSLTINRKGQSIQIIFKDDGKGYPFDRYPDQSNSMGVHLIKSFAEKLTASITLDNTNGANTSITFNLPNLTFIRA